MILGIDPGNTGAIAWLDEHGDLTSVMDMPTMQMKVGGRSVNRLSPPLLAEALEDPLSRRLTAFVEEVHAMPKQGVSSSFNFGFSYGCVHGALAGWGYRIETIRPPEWRKLAGVRGGKDGSRARAIQLWPESAALFARKKDDGRAEAALIAYAGFLKTR